MRIGHHYSTYMQRYCQTVGHLALVKMDFQRADRDGEGALDVQKLGQWVESKGMQSVT